MLRNLQLTSSHTEISEDLAQYTTRKIGSVDRYLPRRQRHQAQITVKLRNSSTADKKSCSCEVTLSLPEESIVVQETTVNLYAAVDIARSQLRLQIAQHRARYYDGRLRRRVMRRFKA